MIISLKRSEREREREIFAHTSMIGAKQVDGWEFAACHVQITCKSS
jgi:hypothetical protein